MARYYRPLLVEELAQIRCDICGAIWDAEKTPITLTPKFTHIRLEFTPPGENQVPQIWVADVCSDCVVKDLASLINFSIIDAEHFHTLTEVEIARLLGRTTPPPS